MPSRPTGGKQGSVTERSQGFVKGQVYWVDRVLREYQQGNTEEDLTVVQGIITSLKKFGRKEKLDMAVW